MSLLTELRVLAAAVEDTPGTAETLDAADAALNAYDAIAQADFEVEQRSSQASMSMLASVVGPRKGSISFKTDLGWDGAELPLWASVLFPACGWVESSQVFTPRSEAPGSNVKTLTIAVYLDGVVKMLKGAVGNFTVTCPAGKMCTIEWEFEGVWVDVADTAILDPTLPVDVPLKFTSGTCTYNSVAQTVAQVVVKSNNNIYIREDGSTAQGYKAGIITGRAPTIELNPEAVLVATQDRYGLWQAGAEHAFSLAIDGPAGTSSNGNITFSAPKAQIVSISEADREKVVVDEVELQCNKNGTTDDEELSITFTDKVDI